MDEENIVTEEIIEDDDLELAEDAQPEGKFTRLLEGDAHKFKLSGSYETVTDVILQFVSNHKPEGLRVFDELKSEPHEGAMFGEFEHLPQPLEPYIVH